MADLDPVIKTIIAEALGEGADGMRYVGETIVNRAEQRGLTPAGVVQQPYQYTGYSNPGPAAVKAFNDPAIVSAAQAAWQLAQGPGDPTGGANHYYAPGTISQPGWAKGMTNTLTHGGHAFYTDRPYTQKGLGPLAAPVPQQMTPTLAALQQMGSPSKGNTALQQYVNERATAARNKVTPAIPAWVTTMNQGGTPIKSGPLSAAQQAAARRLALQMQTPSYAGQEGKQPSLAGLSPAQQAAANRATLLSGGNGFSYAGNQGSGSIPPRPPSAFGSFPQGGQIPQAAGSFNFGKNQAQLSPNGGLPNPFQVNQYGAPANVPMPRPRPNPGNLPGVNPTNVAMPRPRPNTGMTVPQPMPANMRPNGAPVPFLNLTSAWAVPASLL